MGWKHTVYHIINSDPGHTRSKQQLDKTLKKWREGKKEKKTRMAIAKLFAFHANANTHGSVKYPHFPVSLLHPIWKVASKLKRYVLIVPMTAFQSFEVFFLRQIKFLSVC